MRRSVVITTLLVLALGGAVAVFALRSSPPDPRSEARRFAAQTERELARLPRTELPESLPDVAASARSIRERIAATLPIDTADSVSPERAPDFLEMATTFLALLRIADSDAYAAWMRGNGFTIREQANAWEEPEKTYRWYAGEQAKPDFSMLDFFHVAFEGWLRHNENEFRPIAIALGEDDEGQALGNVVIGWRTVDDSNSVAALRHLMQDDRFIGSRSQGGRQHWRPPISEDEIIERDGRVLVAELRIGAVTQGGHALPMRILGYFDPAASRWLFDNAFIQNAYDVDVNIEV